MRQERKERRDLLQQVAQVRSRLNQVSFDRIRVARSISISSNKFDNKKKKAKDGKTR